tara:strand:+ start:337 stop:528 length:192 start_codon:yes stop_codon:yes gene_type:complete
MANSLVDLIVGQVFNDTNKKKVVDKWNKDINIPIINEKTEEKILSAMYECVEAVLKTAVIKIK